MDIILKALVLELELIVLCLQDSPGGSLVFDFLGMLYQQVILLHLCQVSLLTDLDELLTLLRDPAFGLIHITTELTNLFLISTLLKSKVERVVLLNYLIELRFVPVPQVLDKFIVLIASALKGSLDNLKLPP